MLITLASYSRKPSSFLLWVLVLLVFSLGLPDVGAQTSRGTVTGLVTDSTGAVVPGAGIEVV